MGDFATESGHWYRPDGSPLYEVEKASGGELRPTTLRDARKLGLYPSVTGVMRELAAPALVMWKAKEAVKAARHMRRKKDETDDQFALRAVYEVDKQVKEKAEQGAKIHGAIEQAIQTGDCDEEYGAYVDPVLEYLNDLDGLAHWDSEHSFARDGFGGKVDLHKHNCVVDFKTKDFTSDDKNPDTYENHGMQLGAYRHGLDIDPDARGIIIFISRTEPGLIHPVTISPEEMTKGYVMFIHLFRLWCVRRDYYPANLRGEQD